MTDEKPEIDTVLDQLARDGALPEHVVETLRTLTERVTEAAQAGDDAAQCAAQADLFRFMATQYGAMGQADVAAALQKLANETDPGVH